MRIYGSARSSVERVNSILEGLICLERHRVRGLRNITVHMALRHRHAPLAVAAHRFCVPEKARLIATFGWRRELHTHVYEMSLFAIKY